MTPPKRIALIIPGGLGTGNNNLGVPVLEQIVKLLSARFAVTVFQLYKVNDDYEPKGFVLLDFKSGNRLIQYFKFIISFYKTHRRNKFIAVHGFWIWPCGFLAVLLGKIFKIKSIAGVLGGDGVSVPEINYGHLRNSFSRRMILWSLQNAEEAVALTNYLAHNLSKYGLKRNLKIIPYGVDPDLFAFRPHELEYPIQFLNVGNFNLVKDHKTLLYAFELIQHVVNSHLTIIGEGDEEVNVRNMISSLKLEDKVTIRNHLPYHELPAVYQNSHVLLHTSLAEGEAVVAVEAMSCGVLICGTDVGIIADLSGQCCISVSTRDFQELANKVIELLNSPDMQNTLRNNARVWAKTHSLHWTVQQYELLYENTKS